MINDNCKLVDWLSYNPQVMITDPPYANRVHKNATSQSKGGGARHRDLGFDCISSDIIEWTADLASKVERWSVIHSDLESIGVWKDALENAGAKYIRAICWTRWSMPSLCGWPPQGSEAIILAYGKGKGRKLWNGPGNLTHFSNTCLRGEGKHKCEKPLDLVLDLVKYFSNPKETVIDPFSGSGTTGIACKILDRNYVGCEIDEEWSAKADDRINACKVDNDKVLGLTDRDQERYNRWLQTQTFQQEEMERMKKHTTKVRENI